MKRLIFTADDFGAAVAINEAVEQAHRHGLLTAASLMVTGDAAEDAVVRAREMPGLGVGLHLVLVDGQPALPPDQIPALVGSDGKFRADMIRTAIRIFASPAARRQLDAEIEAQFAAFAATGLGLDHVNAHKHFHLHPTILAAVLRIGKRYGMRSLRAPVEPGISGVAGHWAKRVRRRARAAGLSTPDQVFGLAWSGAFDAERLRALLPVLPEGLSEVYFHPATHDEYAGHAPGYRHRDELAALTDRDAIALAASMARGCFADFAEPSAQ